MGTGWLRALVLLVVGSIGALTLGGCGSSGTGQAPTARGSVLPRQAWLSSAWKFRRPIVVQNGAARSLTDYQVEVSLPSAFDFSDAASTGDDIRFTNSNGTAALDYWKEAFDPTRRTGVFWVKVPSIGARSSRTIYIYYGNPAAASASDGPATFPFFDDFTRSAWASLPDMPISTADAGAAVVNGKFYIIGGYDDTPGDPLGTNYEFDPQTSTYSPRSPMPTPRWGAIAVGVGDKVYVFGGGRVSEATPVRVTDVYDTLSDSWTARGPAPREIAKEGITGCTDGTHVFLFADGGGYRYDVSTDRYSPLASMPHYVGNWASCGYYQGKIYLVGGFSYDRQVESSTQIYDISTNHWSSGRPMPFATYGSVREDPIVGNTMYIVQGQRQEGEFSSEAYAYNLSTNSWSDRSLGPHAADGVAGGVYDGKIFTFGGRQDLSGPYGLSYASVYDPGADQDPPWRQVTGGFEMSDGHLRRMVPPRGSDQSTKVHAPRFSELQTRDFQTKGNFALEARTTQAPVGGGRVAPGSSWNSIGVQTNLDENGSALAGCQVPFNDYRSAPTSTRIMAVRGSTLVSLASLSPAANGVMAYGVERSGGNLVLTENSRPVLGASDQSCRSGKGYLTIQTAGDNGSAWSSLFVRTYSAVEPRVVLPGWGPVTTTSSAPTATPEATLRDHRSLSG